MKKRICLLGSTGSIGRQTLEVCKLLNYSVPVLVAGQSLELLLEQATLHQPELIVLADESRGPELLKRCEASGLSCAVRWGRAAVIEAAAYPDADLVVAAMVGMAGLEPVLRAIQAGKDVALANKETLVVAGNLVMNEVAKAGVKLLPVDSEHSAIWQCLATGRPGELERIFLTCSGGPFHGRTRAELETITVDEALAHPVWRMGGKISIDSATLMNKGLELIEACHLFNVNESQVEVVIHPESIIHSMVSWKDQSVIAQLGFPDMRLPIQLALSYPERLASLERPFDPFDETTSTLHFGRPDEAVFKALGLARAAQREGRRLPIVLNAVNEVAVTRFLAGKLRFLEITEAVETIMESFSNGLDSGEPDLTEILEIDRKARLEAERLCDKWAV